MAKQERIVMIKRSSGENFPPPPPPGPPKPLRAGFMAEKRETEKEGRKEGRKEFDLMRTEKRICIESEERKRERSQLRTDWTLCFGSKWRGWGEFISPAVLHCAVHSVSRWIVSRFVSARISRRSNG